MSVESELDQSLERIQYKNYFIREDGVVFNQKGEKRQPYICINRNGRRYLKVDLFDNGKREKWFLHRLVAWVYLAEGIITFEEFKLMYVDHINNDPGDCSAWNVELMTCSGNLLRRHREFSNIPF